MGIFGHNDLFARKYLTAIIRDSHDRGYFIHIKKTLDDYFITQLNNTFYAFSLEGARIITHRWFGVRSFRWIDYDTTHYRSIQYDKLEELKLFLIKNRLPRMNMLQYYMIKLLGRKERKKALRTLYQAKTNMTKQLQENNIDDPSAATISDATNISVPPHDIQALLDELAINQDQYQDESHNLINYIQSLDIDHIVTPCQKISEYIEDDLIATKPSFLGELMPRLMRLLGKHGQIVNSPYSTKSAWLTKLMLISFVAVGAAMIYWMYTEGFFDSITSMIPNTDSFAGVANVFDPAASTVDQCSDEYLQANITPEALKIAQEDGSNTCELSEQMQEWVDDVELPTAAPVAAAEE